MKKIYIWGTGSTGKRVYEDVKDKYHVIGFLDNDERKWGTNIMGVKVVGNAKAVEGEFDEILVCAIGAFENIQLDLMKCGVPEYKINGNYIRIEVDARIQFLRDFAKLIKGADKHFCVAEGGVFQGDFSKEINAIFPDRDFYLFDTFEGFDSRDIACEEKGGFSVAKSGELGLTNIDLVKKKLPYPEHCIIRKGYFPETVKGLEDKTFAFVNLDFDLYNPTVEGLRFFYPRMMTKGLILIHDYFNSQYSGISEAVSVYEKERGRELIKLPIGDRLSIAILKTDAI